MYICWRMAPFTWEPVWESAKCWKLAFSGAMLTGHPAHRVSKTSLYWILPIPWLSSWIKYTVDTYNLVSIRSFQGRRKPQTKSLSLLILRRSVGAHWTMLQLFCMFGNVCNYWRDGWGWIGCLPSVWDLGLIPMIEKGNGEKWARWPCLLSSTWEVKAGSIIVF